MTVVAPIGPSDTRVGIPDPLVRRINDILSATWTQAEAEDGRDIDLSGQPQFIDMVVDAYVSQGWQVRRPRRKHPGILRFIRGLDGMDLVVGSR